MSPHCTAAPHTPHRISLPDATPVHSLGLTVQVCALLKYLLTLIDKNDINYADVDDVFLQTTVEAPDGADGEDRIPMYSPPKQFRAALTIPRRKLPPVRDYEVLLPSSHSAAGTEKAKIFEKTYGENLGHWIILRLFFFMFHAHWLLFTGCLLLTMEVQWEV